MQKGIQENVYQFATVFTKTHRIYMATDIYNAPNTKRSSHVLLTFLTMRCL